MKFLILVIKPQYIPYIPQLEFSTIQLFQMCNFFIIEHYVDWETSILTLHYNTFLLLFFLLSITIQMMLITSLTVLTTFLSTEQCLLELFTREEALK